MGSTLDDLRASPETVKDGIGYALELAQKREKPENAKPLRGFRGASVMQVVQDFGGNTWRAIYTVAIAERVYVLHFFQKKLKRGIATPRKEIDLIERRLRQAIEHGKTGRS